MSGITGGNAGALSGAGMYADIIIGISDKIGTGHDSIRSAIAIVESFIGVTTGARVDLSVRESGGEGKLIAVGAGWNLIQQAGDVGEPARKWTNRGVRGGPSGGGLGHVGSGRFGVKKNCAVPPVVAATVGHAETVVEEVVKEKVEVPVVASKYAGMSRHEKNKARKRDKKQRELADAERNRPTLRAGYFDGLSEEIQNELKETRAKLLIEKNRRELAQEQQKINRMNSPMTAVMEAMKAIAVANKIAKQEADNSETIQARDSRVLGWAKTVATNYAATISSTGSKDKAAKSATVSSSVSANSSVSCRDEQGVRVKKLEKKPIKKNDATVRRDVDVGVVGLDRSVGLTPEVEAIDKKVAALRVAAGREVCTRPDRFVRWLITNKFFTDAQISATEKFLGRLPKPVDYLNGTLMVSSEAKIMIAEMKHAFF